MGKIYEGAKLRSLSCSANLVNECCSRNLSGEISVAVAVSSIDKVRKKRIGKKLDCRME